VLRALWTQELVTFRGRHHRITDAGHYIQEDAHEQVIPPLLDFLKRA